MIVRVVPGFTVTQAPFCGRWKGNLHILWANLILSQNREALSTLPRVSNRWYVLFFTLRSPCIVWERAAEHSQRDSKKISDK